MYVVYDVCMCDHFIFSVQFTYSDMSHNDEAPEQYVYMYALLNLEFLQPKLGLFWNNLLLSKFHPKTTTS